MRVELANRQKSIAESKRTSTQIASPIALQAKEKRSSTIWMTGATTKLGQRVFNEVNVELILDVPTDVATGITFQVEGGLYIITELKEGSPAADGRLRLQDKILEINNKSVNAQDVALALGAHSSSRNLILVVSRVIPSEEVTREQEFLGRHGLPRVLTAPTDPIRWREGLIAQGVDKQSEVIVNLKYDKIVGFGIQLVGPEQSNPTASRVGIYISGVYAGTPAARNERIRRGYQIVDINGWDMTSASLDDAYQLLTQAKQYGRVNLALRPNPTGFALYDSASLHNDYTPLVPDSVTTKPEFEYRTVVIQRQTLDQSLGIALVGPAGTDANVEPRGIFVSKLDENGLAFKGGQLKEFDQILEANGLNLTLATHPVEADVLRCAGLRVSLLVASNKQGFDYQATQLDKLIVSVEKLLTNRPQRLVRLQSSKMDYGIELVGSRDSSQTHEGVFVGRINNSATLDGGLQVGDLIVELNGEKVIVSSLSHVQALIDQSSELRMVVTQNPTVFEKFRNNLGAPVRKVRLVRSDQGFGIKLIGPAIYDPREPNGVFVSYVDKTSPAGLDGRLAIGDQIIAVNDVKLRESTRNEALSLIAESGDVVTFSVVANPTGYAPFKADVEKFQKSVKKADEKRRKSSKRFSHQPDNVKNIVLQRDNAQVSLGMSICGPADATDLEHVGVFVSAITPAGLVGQDGRLAVGDQIFGVNGADLRFSSVEEATVALKNSGTTITLSVAPNPAGFEKFSESLKEKQTRTVVISRRIGEGVGFSIVGGSEHGNDGIFISNVLYGGPASTFEGLRVGEQILSINNKGTIGMSLADASRAIEENASLVTLDVLNNPDGFATYAAAIVKARENTIARALADQDLRFVELQVGVDGLGFEIAGRSEKSDRFSRNGIFVSAVKPGGVAEKSGVIHVGDQIVEVSGEKQGEWTSLRTLSQEKAIEVIRSAQQSQKSVAFVLGTNPEGFSFINEALDSSRVVRSITLERPATGGLGFGIVGPTDLNSLASPNGRGIYVAEIQPGSIAETVGHLQFGDRIVSVNGKNVVASHHSEAVKLIQEAGSTVTLEVTYDINGFSRADHTPKIPASAIQRSSRGSSRRKRSVRRKHEYPALPFHVRALFDNTTSVEGHLNFKVRDILLVTDVSNVDWWAAENISSGEKGLIPSRYKYDQEHKPTTQATEKPEAVDLALGKVM
jgi:C-terminal processing protease CtpA/Prc